MEQRQIHGDNQQQSFLDWFGGIVDGEGCLTFRCRWQRGRYIQITPTLMIVNTSQALIDECVKGLTSLYIPFYLSVRHPKAKTVDGQSRRAIYELEVQGLKRMSKLIPLLRVRAKKDQLSLITQFTQSRLQLKGHQKTPYSVQELRWVEELAKLHSRKNAQRLYARLLQHQGG